MKFWKYLKRSVLVPSYRCYVTTTVAALLLPLLSTPLPTPLPLDSLPLLSFYATSRKTLFFSLFLCGLNSFCPQPSLPLTLPPFHHGLCQALLRLLLQVSSRLVCAVACIGRFVCGQTKSRHLAMNNCHRSVLVRVPVGRGPLLTVKHICFGTCCC